MLSVLALAGGPGPAVARSLTSVFSSPQFAGLQLAPLGPALANTVASTYPIASASSSVTYVYNPALETFERQTSVLGPIIGERAETIGKGQMNVGASYSYVHLSSINGDDLDDLVNKPVIHGSSYIFFPVPGNVRLQDGRITSSLPVHVNADIGVTANLISLLATFGLTPDWDVNVTLPIVQTSLSLTADATVPDPRLPQFALPPGSPLAQTRMLEDSESAFGVGDLLLRTKYVLLRERPVDVAASLALSLPSGSASDLRGTGNVYVRPQLIVSRIFEERIEPLLNIAVDINANDVSRSAFAWAAGATAQMIGPLNAAVVFLGRSEFSPLADPIEQPFFFQIERNDLFDVSCGLRFLFAETGVISANALVPLNDAGLRADVIPTVEVEYAFSTPW